MTHTVKYTRFKSLHQPGAPLALYNIWDAGSAKAVSSTGAQAIATSSAAVAMAQGYEDGEYMPFADLLRTAEQVARSTALPCSVDFEAGYTGSDRKLKEHTAALLRIGVVGVNFEDWDKTGSRLRTVSEQTKRIHSIKQVSEQVGLPLFINARTDLFLREADQNRHKALLPQAIERAYAYRDAGAECFFAPCLVEAALIKELCEKSPIPINIMMMEGAPTKAELAELGVSRISFGFAPYMEAVTNIEEAAKRWAF